MITERKFEIFDVKCNIDKLNELKKQYLENLSKPILYKVISNIPSAWNSQMPIYDFDKIFKSKKYYEFGLVPVKGLYTYFIDDFTFLLPENANQVKAFRRDSEEIYLYSKAQKMFKNGKNYMVCPVILINKDLYNIFKIYFGDYLRVIGEDISVYKDYFSVSDTPRDIVSNSFFYEEYMSGMISQEEYNSHVNYLERREKLVRTLKK